MPENPLRRLHGRSSPEEPGLDALLDGRPVPDEAAATVPEGALDAVRIVLAAASAPAEPAELTGEAAAVAAFRRANGVSSPASRRRLRRPAMLSSLLTAKIALAAGTAVAAVGGTAAAAYTGSLPSGLQNFAHHAIGAPAGDEQNDTTAAEPTDSPDPSETPDATETPDQTDTTAEPTASGTPVGPDATGPAAFGLCTAYAAATKDGQDVSGSVAFQNLAKAAGGFDQIPAYCATIPHPGNTAHPTGKPSSVPAHATGRPATAPSHANSKPTTTPEHGNGKSSGAGTNGSSHASAHRP